MDQTESIRIGDYSEISSNVYSIPPGAPFLPTLADAIIKGVFQDDLDIREDPLAFSEATVFLPTRRAARGLGIALLEAAQKRSGSTSIVLPRIRTIGDLDEEELLFGLDSEAYQTLLSGKDGMKVIDPVERHLALARLIQNWTLSLSPETTGLLENEAITLPSSASDALFMAQELAKFMDQIETEEADWQSISKIGENTDFTIWWQLTLDFLKIIMEVWPKYLKAGNLMNPAAFRNQVINFRINQLISKPQKGFVLAAGTTGSVPATARLLETIQKLPNGAVVLPGLDCALPKDVIQRIGAGTELLEEGAASTHPQYGMVKLLQKLKVHHSDVTLIGEPNNKLKARESILSSVTVPAEDSTNWISSRQKLSQVEIDNALDGVCLIEAANEQDEALAIALALREVLEHPNKTAALVTPDRKLAKRVSAELERFNIQIDDTAGEALSTSKSVSFLRQLLNAVFDQKNRLSLSSFLKNSLILLGEDRIGLSDNLELLELLLVRETTVYPDLTRLEELVAQEEMRLNDVKHAAKPLKQLEKSEWDRLQELAAKLSQCLTPLTALANRNEPITLSDLMLTLRETGEGLSTDVNNEIQLYEVGGGEELAKILTGYGIEHDTGFKFPTYEAPAVFDSIVSGNRTRKLKRTRSRLHIYGTLEARLQSNDLTIIAGLNEGNWPASTQNDPFLNRPMRSYLHLPLPERRIGLAAHDFTQLSGGSEIIYSRSLRDGDAPSIASRWIQRLKTFLGESEKQKLIVKGHRYLSTAKNLNQSDTIRLNIVQPAPTPPLSARPKALSITEIETWIRDPYAIYGKHILKLNALPPIEREADAALRGTIYHNILAEFVETWRSTYNEAATNHIRQISKTEFEKYGLPAEISAAWEPRFLNIAEGFLAWESDRQSEIKESHCEIDLNGEIEETGFHLRGRADRIDLRFDGSLEIIDYKTGSYPNKKQARLFSPQLSLEGALASRGFAKGIDPAPLSKLLYVRLRERDKFEAEDITVTPKKEKTLSADELAEKTYEDLKKHILAYQSQSQAYVSQYAPQPNKNFAGDYDHLARIKEWSLTQDENDEGDA